MITFLFVCAAVTFMVLGWYTDGNTWHLILSCFCAVMALIGVFSKRFHAGFEKGYNAVLTAYKKGTRFFVNHKITSFAFVAIAIVALVWLMKITPTALVPNEDTGVVFVMVDMPPGTSQERTEEVMEKVDGIIRATPGVAYSNKDRKSVV